ncbi:hypothetical protein BGZ67_002001 [Mortierella alpina]|nr:hypothetical protein BGZ67_002001 [Mortierella alpina]
MESSAQIILDLKCLAFGGPDGSKAYALVEYGGTYVLIQAQVPAADPRLLTWDFVTAGWSLPTSYYLNGVTASCSCIINKAGELIAMRSWSTAIHRGLVYNPFNPLPQVEGRFTSNALWMEVNVASSVNNTEGEKDQIMIDTGAEDNSAMEIALTGSHVLIRRLHATGFTTRELVSLGGWALPRPLAQEHIAQVRYSSNFVYILTNYEAYGAADTSLVRIPLNPNATFSSQLLTGPPTGTTAIDISSSISKCSWNMEFFTAASDNKFYLLCQRDVGLGYTVNLFIYDNKAGAQTPKLGAAVTVTGIDPSTKIRLFQPLKNTTFAMLVCRMSNSDTGHILLSLSGSNVGNTTRLANAWISVDHDTLFNNILPDQAEIPVPRTDGIPSEERVIGSVFGVLAVLAAVIFLTLRHRRRQRSKKNRQEDAETSPNSFGIEPIDASGSSSAAGLTAGVGQSNEAYTHLSPIVYVAPQTSIPPSSATSAELPVSSWPTSPPTVASAAPLSSMTLSPAPSEGSPSVPTSGSPPANTYQMELQQLGFSSHPRPNIVTTVND